MNDHLFEENKSSSVNHANGSNGAFSTQPRRNEFMQYLEALDPVKKDAGIGINVQGQSQRSVGDSSRLDVDEFNNDKHSHTNNNGNQEQSVAKKEGFTNMNKDQYRKSSKENFLQKMNSHELMSSHPSHVLQDPKPGNNIIIDLTNKLYEESNYHTNNKHAQQTQQTQQQQQYPINIQASQIPVDIVRQKDIDDFKRQIQLDLQKLTQVLEENNKKQHMQQRIEFQQKLEEEKRLEMLQKETEKIQRSIQAELSQEFLNNSQIDQSPKAINRDLSDVSSVKVQSLHVIPQSQKQRDSQEKSFFTKKQKSLQHENDAIHRNFRYPNKGPQSNVQPLKGHSAKQSVRSGNTSFAAGKGQANTNPHQRLQSNQGQNNQFYLNLQQLQNESVQQIKGQAVLYSAGFRNKYQQRSNSREKKFNASISNYNTKSPQSYSSVQSYSMNSRSIVKQSAIRNPKQPLNGSQVILEEEDFNNNNQDSAFFSQVLQENEELKQALHQLRLKNAELRTEVTKVRRDHQESIAANHQLEEKVRLFEKQRKKDCDYILKQESEIEKFLENKNQSSSMIKVQEDQINNLKSILNQTINVKIKYENIIKWLVENDRTRDMVLGIIEQVQSSQNHNMNQQIISVPQSLVSPHLYDQTQASLFLNSTLPSNIKVPNSGIGSMNATQNISHLLAQAAAMALGKNQSLPTQNHLESMKPQLNDDFDEEQEDEYEEDQ